jgi:hypothetical protein
MGPSATAYRVPDVLDTLEDLQRYHHHDLADLSAFDLFEEARAALAHLEHLVGEDFDYIVPATGSTARQWLRQRITTAVIIASRP